MKEVELILGDCIEEMGKLEDNSIDCIICDLPYGTTSCSWDEVIPFKDLWEQYNRVVKKNAPIVLFGSQPFTSLLVSSNIKNFKEELIWLKNRAGSGMQSNQKHIKIHENICVFANSGSYTYNPQKWLIEEKEFITQRKTFKKNEYIGNRIYGATTRTRKEDTGERNPISIVSCRVPFTPQKDRVYNEEVDLRYHPTQKPLELMRYLVRTYSNEGDIILDSCMGSGTTGVVCKELGRKFIGIEKEESYYRIAEERISRVDNSGEMRGNL